MIKQFFFLFVAVSMVSFMTACGGGSTTTETEETTQEAPAPAAAETSSEPAATGQVVEVEISGNDQMRYDKERIEVPAGSTVKLTLKHIGQLPKEAMGHNFVLLVQGTNMEDFAMKAITASGNDYIPASEEGKIIAHTKMLGGGESATIEFEAPAAGEYDFMCSFPGHWGFMKGKFVVK